MVRTKGGLIGNQGRGVERGCGRARDRGRGCEVQPNRGRLVELANVPMRSRTYHLYLQPQLAMKEIKC